MLDDSDLARVLESWRRIITEKMRDGYTLSMNIYTEDPQMLTMTVSLSKPEPKPVDAGWSFDSPGDSRNANLK